MKEKTSRRGFLVNSLGAAAGWISWGWSSPVLSGRSVSSAGSCPENFDYSPFLVGFQSYSLRHFSDLESFVQAAASLHLEAVELYGGHLSPLASADEIERWKSALAEAGMTVKAFGVARFSADHESNKRVFQFAEKLGVVNLSANPDKDAIDSLERLVDEFDIRIAIHNHGPEDEKWRRPEWILEAVKGRDSRIGACVDTGHYLRADIDPVDAIKTLDSRVLGVHLKDFQSDGQERVIGQGRLDVEASLKALYDVGFRGPLSLEYEAHAENPVPYMCQGLAVVQDVVRRWQKGEKD